LGFGDERVADLEVGLLLALYGVSVFSGYVLANFIYRFRPIELKAPTSLLMHPALCFLVSLSCFLYLNSYASAPFLFLVNPKVTYISAIDNGLMGFLAVGYMAAFMGASVCLIRRKWLSIIPFIILLFMFGKKTPILWLIIMYGVYNSGFRFNFAQVRGLLLGATLLVGFFSVTHVSDATLMSKIASYFDYYENTSEFVAISEGDSHTFRKSIYESHYQYIPRFIWTEKPLVYGRVNVHAKYYPADLENGYTKGYVSEALIPYKAYGFLYLIFSAFISGFFMTLLFNFANRKNLHMLLWYSCFPNVFFLVLALTESCIRGLKRV